MTDQLCYYCSHNSDVMYGMPVSYDEIHDTFVCTGQFCSWECMKSYNLYSNSSFKQAIFNHIQMMHDKTENTHNTIKFAPPRSLLKVHGGSMTIDEFRANGNKFKMLTFPMKKEENIVERYENFSVKSNAHSEPIYNNIENEPIKLKRKTPKPTSQNTLEKTMGLFKK